VLKASQSGHVATTISISDLKNKHLSAYGQQIRCQIFH
jgi:hypothetical protein